MKEQKKKERLDVLLVKRVLAESREKAKAIIMTGNVFVNDQREDKAGSTFPTDCKIEIKGTPMKYVSRGGYKLEKAIDLWQVPLQDKICMDVGSSTGGFTDCMLQNGASKVYAIDVGTNQLAWKLRQDDRVVSMEKTNIFISLKKVLIPVRNLLGDNGQVVALVKPQFEAGREKVGKKGVVRDQKVHLEVVQEIMTFALSIGFSILELSFSPIKGPEGNIEYLLYLQKDAKKVQWIREQEGIVETEHGSHPTEEMLTIAQKEWEENYSGLAKSIVADAHGNLD